MFIKGINADLISLNMEDKPKEKLVKLPAPHEKFIKMTKKNKLLLDLKKQFNLELI